MNEGAYLAVLAVWLLCGLVAFALAGKALRWDWTPGGLRRHYEDLARRDDHVADSMRRSPRLMRAVLAVVWALFLFAWPAQVVCAPFLPHRWIGQAPRKSV
ncbi:hypothetical protein AB0H73_09515 [Streptomyces olivoreticuli]